MKLLILILALSIAVPPVQAGACDFVQDQVASQPADSGHDCCPDDDSQAPEEQPSCDSQSHCGACTAGVVSMVPGNPLMVSWQQHYICSLASADLAVSHSSPPYRPPIS
jgi:hypothetical protein